MDLVEKLEKRAQELDGRVRHSLVTDSGYDFAAARDRELLEQAARQLRAYQMYPKIVWKGFQEKVLRMGSPDV